MEILKTIAIDVRESVFDSETEGILYITKDVFDDNYIAALPVYTFSWQISNEKDYDYLLRHNIFGSQERRQRLIEAIKKGIATLEG